MNHPKGKFAGTVKVGERGQIVIPKEAREMLHIRPGDTLILLADEKRGIAVPEKNRMETITNRLFGGIMPDEGERKP